MSLSTQLKSMAVQWVNTTTSSSERKRTNPVNTRLWQLALDAEKLEQELEDANNIILELQEKGDL